MKTDREIGRMAMDYAKLCDPLNQTIEKQADIIQGYKAGFDAAMKEVKLCNKPDVIKSVCCRGNIGNNMIELCEKCMKKKFNNKC